MFLEDDVEGSSGYSIYFLLQSRHVNKIYATFIKFIWIVIIFISGQKFTYYVFSFEGDFEIGIF